MEGGNLHTTELTHKQDLRTVYCSTQAPVQEQGRSEKAPGGVGDRKQLVQAGSGANKAGVAL